MKMNMKGKIWSILAMGAMFEGMANMGASRDFKGPYIPPSKPIPFSFKKFKCKEGEELAKGCKCERVRLEFIKPFSLAKYKITAEVDIIYGTQKAAKKKLIQYRNEIGYFIYHTDIRLIERHKEDILIEEIIEQTKQQ